MAPENQETNKVLLRQWLNEQILKTNARLELLNSQAQQLELDLSLAEAGAAESLDERIRTLAIDLAQLEQKKTKLLTQLEQLESK